MGNIKVYIKIKLYYKDYLKASEIKKKKNDIQECLYLIFLKMFVLYQGYHYYKSVVNRLSVKATDTTLNILGTFYCSI